jgi:exopolyphosphatase/guanosine-5'-triphosphate,3'-diphosphate pyrophosphatase
MKRIPDVLAAVDLGSNSFHMVVARYTHGQLVVIDRLREMVRLASGVEENGAIDKDVATRALACLERFGQRLREMKASGVRVVGTSALRVARHKKAFLVKAREALGHPIEVISGLEEARLIYSGVAHTVPTLPGRRLVVDIGGGSTELIIGEGIIPSDLESLKMGCVALSERFFGDGRITAKRLHRARVAARSELEPIQAAYRRRGWDCATGSSGTIRAISEALHELDPALASITPEGLERLLQYSIDAGSTRALALESIDEERRAVFPGGLAILCEVFEVLGVEDMRIADGAMREGLLYDMVGRFTEEDARERTVRAMQQRYHVGHGSWTIPSWTCCSPGQRGCMKSAWTSRTAGITATARICSITPTCLDSRAKSSACSRPWSAGTGASSSCRVPMSSCLPGNGAFCI